MINTVEYRKHGNIITAYVTVSETTTAKAVMGGRVFEETGNKREPFDYTLHIFDFNETDIAAYGEFDIYLTEIEYWPFLPAKHIEQSGYTIKYNPSDIVSDTYALYRSVRNLKLCRTELSGECCGVKWTQELYITQDDKPVRVFSAISNPVMTDLIAGTPEGQKYFTSGKIQTVLEQAEYAQEHGINVVCATNGDFFDIFGDCHPSGLCIRDNAIVANRDIDSAFFGVLTDGKPVIGHTGEFDLGIIKEAVSGREILLKDGKIFETSLLEPFGDNYYPRTAVGIDSHNNVIQIVVDGNNPAWSNGASLAELAILIKGKGAETALNMDGGGSSTFVVRIDDRLTILNHPAGKMTVNEKNGRKLFNSLITAARPEIL